MVSIYSEGINKKELPEAEYFEALNMLAPELFMPILETYHSGGVAKNVVLYMLYAYSNESPKALLPTTWTKNKSDIAKLVDLPDTLFVEIVQLKSPVFRAVMKEYLDLQMDRDFKHLQMNKDFYAAGMDAVMDDLHDDDGKLNFKEMQSRRSVLNSMYDEILALEDKIRGRSEVMTFNKEELAKLESSKEVSADLETSKWLRK